MIAALNLRKPHWVLWVTAGCCMLILLTHSHRQRLVNDIGDVDDDGDAVSNVDSGEGMKTVTFKMEHCDCMRTLRVNVTNEFLGAVPYNETTCGRDAYRRGAGQKVVGFSFYGDVNSAVAIEKGYFDGIVGNLKLMPKFYPGWVMRLYFDLDKTDLIHGKLCDLACSDTNLDICDAANLPGTPMKDATKVFAMNWRFFPTLDPQVDAYVSRDLDSRLNDREIAAVTEWLQSNKDFHFMRDHPYHGTTILGSGWGCKLHRAYVRKKWKKSWFRGFQDPLVWAKRNEHGPDQGFLDKYIWPWAKRHSIGHDSYCCLNYPYTKAFPVQRRNEPNNFVASVVTQNNTLWEVCPVQCRPKNHLDWEHC